MRNNRNPVFLALLQSGLWEKDVNLEKYGFVDFTEIMRLAEEQSVVGLVTAGLEHVLDTKVPQDVLLQFVGQTIQLEQRNKAMNGFVEMLIGQLRTQDIYALLLKGQGIAQCYERPLWRAAGDVDLFLSDRNYSKAVKYLSSKATSVDKEKKYTKHIAMVINGVDVELHGTLRCGLWAKIDRELDQVQHDIFCGGAVRSWLNGNTQVFLPREDEDVVFVFSHVLQHLFKGGVGLRQVSDWCRLIWQFRIKLDIGLLEKKIRGMGVMTEWKAFATLAVDYLGMPIEAMPFYDKSYKKKSERLLSYIIDSGNFGHNRDMSHLEIKQSLIRKAAISWNYLKDCFKLSRVFPLDAPRFFCRFMIDGLLPAIK